jgi:hypothetical protein
VWGCNFLIVYGSGGFVKPCPHGETGRQAGIRSRDRNGFRTDLPKDGREPPIHGPRDRLSGGFSGRAVTALAWLAGRFMRKVACPGTF